MKDNHFKYTLLIFHAFFQILIKLGRINLTTIVRLRYMIKSPTRAHRQLISPKFSSKHPDNVSKLGNVEGEYQLRSNKNAKKI